ncbi:hypothetical protein BKM26_22255 [Pseudomonas avellanae pv. morsprunorum]|uniref:Uncharacterized protein n=1 Tax=Pseudomonas avellanae pv. morsprunorum TaxID=3380385 RepID=A0ABX4YSS7_9PSED|nr:hypothetical protein BKM26_22255 [Pseudomonas avellanae]
MESEVMARIPERRWSLRPLVLGQLGNEFSGLHQVLYILRLCIDQAHQVLVFTSGQPMTFLVCDFLQDRLPVLYAQCTHRCSFQICSIVLMGGDFTIRVGPAAFAVTNFFIAWSLGIVEPERTIVVLLQVSPTAVLFILPNLRRKLPPRLAAH